MAFYFGILSDIDSDVALAAFICTIFFLAMFDFLLGALEYSVKENQIYNQMLQSVYKELMAMGFVNFVIALFTASSTNVTFGEWIDIVDFVGYLLFFVAIFFVLHALYIMFISYNTTRVYAQRHSMSLAEILQDYSKDTKNAVYNALFHMRYLPISTTQQRVEFKIIYALFRDTYWLPPNFDYGLYLSGCLEIYSLEIIDIGLTSWSMLVFLAVLNYVRLKFMGMAGFNCVGFHTDPSRVSNSTLMEGDGGNPYDTVSQRCQLYHMKFFVLCGGAVCMYAFFLFLVSRFYVTQLLSRAGVSDTDTYPEFLMFEESCNISEQVEDNQRNVEINLLEKSTTMAGSRRRMSINTFRGQIETLRKEADRKDDTKAVYKSITRSVSNISENYFNFDALNDLRVFARLKISSWLGGEEDTNRHHENIIFRKMSRNASISPQSGTSPSGMLGNQKTIATKRTQGGRQGSTTITLSGGPMATGSTTKRSAPNSSANGPCRTDNKMLGQMNPQQNKSLSTIEQFKLKQEAQNSGKRRKSSLGDYLTSKNKIKLTEDFSDIYFFSSPLVYFRAVEVGILLNSLYLSMWAVNFISVVDEEADNPAVWQLLMLVPLVVCLPLLGEIVKTASMLSAIAELELDVIGSVLESMEDEKILMNELRSKIERRLIHVDIQAQKKEVVQSLFREIDKDRSGLISRFEFREMLRALHLHYSDHKFKKLFNVIDKDRSGSISESELNDVLFPAEAFEDDVKTRSKIVQDHMEVHKEKKKLVEEKKKAGRRWATVKKLTSGVTQIRATLKLKARLSARRSAMIKADSSEQLASKLLELSKQKLEQEEPSDSSSSSDSEGEGHADEKVKPFENLKSIARNNEIKMNNFVESFEKGNEEKDNVIEQEGVNKEVSVPLGSTTSGSNDDNRLYSDVVALDKAEDSDEEKHS